MIYVIAFVNMLDRSVVVLFAISALVTALPTDRADHVIAKLDPGPRYQYMVGPDGPELVDLWLKTSDVLASARYDPSVNNGYHLFTRSNPITSQPLLLEENNILSASNFDPNKKTVFLVHGWKNTPLSDFNVHLIHAYIQAEDVNLIMVDWSIGAGGTYLSAINNVIRSAEHVAQFISWLNLSSGADIARYHIIGHSLGAHQVGIIGRHLGGIVPYITALDPAFPGWITNRHAFRPTDGIYTEVMHTDAGVFGIIREAGDVDFYPNRGRTMPGCNDSDCSHHRCIFYMAESLVSGGFTGRRCDSWLSALSGNCNSSETLKMGGVDAKTGSTGIYFLTTNAYSPFSQG